MKHSELLMFPDYYFFGSIWDGRQVEKR